ncbi:MULTISPECIES: FbpB family small basic protein [Geomicrobium]|uniref:Membrane protein YqjE n=1 Tax=Geomicrobium sediminis TaxID=1347788 RepID=A0ABS2PBH7_9BACL|nr:MULTISPECIES: FbpB family small basic protein [Geomicrobium]MBM7632696.1 putative membrane protein YqjE [Geomicrobium sediminis]
MKRIKKARFQELLRTNREQIMNDREALEKIDAKLDSKRKA